MCPPGSVSDASPTALERRLAFAARVEPRLSDIFYAEALAAHAAIVTALERDLVKRRLLLFSDNAATVYAFDSGSAPGPVLTLVHDSYDRLRAAGVDFRIRHVPGSVNTTADTLSRASLPLLEKWFLSSLSLFHPAIPSPPRRVEGGAP